MSTLFASGTAAHVREDLRDLLEDGLAPRRVVDDLVADYEEILSDPDEAPMFWIGLAAAQLELGEVEPLVREKALAVLESGDALTPKRRPLSPDRLAERRAALAELEQQLT